jgi:putative aminopeptidase FrvX
MVDEAHGLLRELLTTYGPCGQEDAVRDVCRRELEPLVDETSVDPAGNLVVSFAAVTHRQSG